MKKPILYAAIGGLLLLLGVIAWYMRRKNTGAATVSPSPTTGNKIIDDLKLMQKGIEAYLAKYGEYPNTGGKWTGYGIKTTEYANGTSEQNWLPKISDFIGGNAPIMNKTNPEETEQAYMYISNGTDYKLIAHLIPNKTNELAKANYPDLIDPTRNGWALAVYTPGLKNG